MVDAGEETCNRHAAFYIALMQYDNARQSVRQAQAVLDNPNLQEQNITAINAFLLLQLSDFSIANDFGGNAISLNEESLALFKSIDDAWGTAVTHHLHRKSKPS